MRISTDLPCTYHRSNTSMKPSNVIFMRDWLRKGLKGRTDSQLDSYLECIPNLDQEMRNLLQEELNLTELQVQDWIHKYRQHQDSFGKSKYDNEESQKFHVW